MQVAQETTPPMQLTVTVGAVVVALLVGLSFFFRLAAIGEVPLAETETRQALSAWRFVQSDAPGNAITSASPVLFWSQAITFGLLGGNEFNARVLTALAGVLLSLAPLFFRELLGDARAFLFALLLAFSPVALVSSRLSAGVVWALLFAMLGLWCLWRYWQVKSTAYGLIATSALAAMVLLSDPLGVLLGIVLVVAALLALYLTALDAPREEDIPGSDFLLGVRERLGDFPSLTGVGVGVLVVVAVSTGFMLFPNGLSMIAELLGSFFSGFTQSGEGTPLFFGLLTSLFYELGYWILALTAVVIVLRRDTVTFIDRFLLAWVVVAGFSAVIYQGGGAAHALLLTVPLAGLASYAVTDALTANDVPRQWFEALVTDEDLRETGLRWGKWLLAVVMFSLLVMVTVHFQILSRGVLQVPGGSLTELFNRLDEPGFVLQARALIWFFISILFIIVGYFLAASIFGGLATVRGGIIGLLAFVVMVGISTGWNIAVDNLDDATELWHVEAHPPDASLLRDTLLELADRQTLGFTALPVAAVVPDDGIIAWALRDFQNARFVEDISAARAEQLIIAPDTNPQSDEPSAAQDLPDLGGSYVGQRFIMGEVWSLSLMEGFDFLPWWATRESRFQPLPSQTYVLWVRQDIFDGTPIGSF